MTINIFNTLKQLDKYVKRHDHAGWDPFDGLNSRLFLYSGLSRISFVRLCWIQLLKHLPINLRNLTLVPLGRNPKGLALFASGCIMLNRIQEARRFLQILDKIKYSDSDGTAWGYDFPWQARAFYVPKETPNMVVTTFVAQAMLDMYEIRGEEKWLQLARSSCRYIVENLILEENDRIVCFGYIPGESARIHNANLMGAALLGRVFKHTKDLRLYELSEKSVSYTMNALTQENMWPYGERVHHSFVDNFHTGFNLVALKQWMECTGQFEHGPKVQAAYKTYLDVFWLEDGCPKYYHNSLYPIDIHNSAQGILTCIFLAEYDDKSLEVAQKIANWAVKNMQDPEGYFYYQKTRWYTNKIPYMRWSQAWMFYALATYLSNKHSLSAG